MDKGGRTLGRDGGVAQVGRVVGSRPPLMCHCCRAPSATDGPGQPPVTAARLAPASLHFFRHDGQLLVHPPPSLPTHWRCSCGRAALLAGRMVLRVRGGVHKPKRGRRDAGGGHRRRTRVGAARAAPPLLRPPNAQRQVFLPHHHDPTKTMLMSGFVLQSKPDDARGRRCGRREGNRP
jgi:hypothetical protein